MEGQCIVFDAGLCHQKAALAGSFAEDYPSLR